MLRKKIIHLLWQLYADVNTYQVLTNREIEAYADKIFDLLKEEGK